MADPIQKDPIFLLDPDPSLFSTTLSESTWDPDLAVNENVLFNNQNIILLFIDFILRVSFNWLFFRKSNNHEVILKFFQIAWIRIRIQFFGRIRIQLILKIRKSNNHEVILNFFQIAWIRIQFFGRIRIQLIWIRNTGSATLFPYRAYLLLLSCPVLWSWSNLDRLWFRLPAPATGSGSRLRLRITKICCPQV